MAISPVRTVPVLTFLGATGTVTGSRFLIDTEAARILVDCGLYQGVKELRLRNWEPFPVEPASLDAVVLTHAHVDHCGYVPALARLGFEGPVYATPDTVELAGIVLPDSGHLMEEEAAYANRRGYSKHRPAKPLYTKSEAEAALGLFESLPFGETGNIAEGVSVTLRPSGHILGAASVLLELRNGTDGRRVLFSGDLGRDAHPLLVPPEPIGGVDVVVMESTYGDRLHDDAGRSRGARRRNPAHSRSRRHCGDPGVRGRPHRSGAVSHSRAARSGPHPRPAGLRRQPHGALGAAGLSPSPRRGEARRPARAADGWDRDVLGTGEVREARDVEASKAIDRHDFPSIVISASGMATGGRVLHHLTRRLPDPRNTIVLVGFQAVQTRGRMLAEGAREIKMLGRYVPVRAEIVTLPSFSVHADREELVAWLRTATSPPEHVYLVHGEAGAAAKLAGSIADELGWVAVVPTLGERVRLD